MACCGGGATGGIYGANNKFSCCPLPCPPPMPKCCGNPCSVAPCCPSPRLTLCKPDPCPPCCQPMKPCPPRCPTIPCFPKVCCPPPCYPDPCIRPSRKCFVPPPCCPPPCCKKMAVVVNSPMCPTKCCPPVACCPPDPCACPSLGCCPRPCPSPAMIVRPIRNNCCPPPPKGQNQTCPIPCCNPQPPFSMILKPCQPNCPVNPCVPLPPTCGIGCSKPNSVCGSKPTVLCPKCPPRNCPPCKMPQQESVSCCPQPCPPKQTEMCMMSVRPMPPKCCPTPPPCKKRSNQTNPCNIPMNPSPAAPPIAPSKALTRPRGISDPKLCCRPKWVKVGETRYFGTDYQALPALPPRYKRWTLKVSSRTDTNLSASRLSAKYGHTDVIKTVPPPGPPKDCKEPCPCPRSRRSFCRRFKA